MNTLSTSAWVAHDLGIAAGFGGSLFGKFALPPAVDAVSSDAERGRVVNAAWRTYAPINLFGHLLAATTWLVGRRMLSGQSLGKDVRRLVLVKDALMAGSVATGVAAHLIGKSMNHQAEAEELLLDGDGEDTSEDTPMPLRAKQRMVSRIGTANLLCNAGLLAITALLAMKAGRSVRFPFLARILP